MKIATVAMTANQPRAPDRSCCPVSASRGSAASLVLNDPALSGGDVLFVAVLFAVAWLAGLALRERAEQVEAAEERAGKAEREREGGGAPAVAEERARIARELHDIVAHSVSVMALQGGAVRYNLPAERAEDREALTGVERTGRTALVDMRPPARGDAP